MKLIGDKIKEIRLQHKMTQTELANELNLSKSIISAYENNIRIPSLEVLFKISDFFNVSSAYFIDENASDNYKLTVDITDLTLEQTKIIALLIEEFRNQNKNKKDDYFLSSSISSKA